MHVFIYLCIVIMEELTSSSKASTRMSDRSLLRNEAARMKSGNSSLQDADELLARYNNLVKDYKVANSRIVNMLERVNTVDQIEVKVVDLYLEIQARGSTEGIYKIYRYSILHYLACYC